MHSFNMNDYEVQFELIFQVPEVSDHFSEFLLKEMNIDPFNFCLQVDQYRHITCGPKRQIEKARFIIDKFIRVNSECEVNVDNKTRQIVSNFSTTIPIII